MKTISAALKTHLEQETTTIATAWLITRVDGTVFRFTAHTRDVSADFGIGEGLQTYTSKFSYSRSNIQNDSEMTVNNMDLSGIFDDASITEKDLRGGLFNNAEVRFFLFNYLDTSAGVLKVLRGFLGEVRLSPHGQYSAELRSIEQILTKSLGELYSKDCRADLGDNRCKVPISPIEVLANTSYVIDDVVRLPGNFDDRSYRVTVAGTTGADPIPVFDTGLGNTTIWGGVTFTAEQALMRIATVTAVDGSEPKRKFTVTSLTPNTSFPDNHFDGGGCTFDTGLNAGISLEVQNFIADDGITIVQEIDLFLEMPFAITVGDTLHLFPGCDKLKPTCIDKFDNILNFIGEPHVPGEDFVFSTPDRIQS